MKELKEMDQKVLKLLSMGVPDHEICSNLTISQRTFAGALVRIEARAGVESDDAGRFYERALKQRAQRKNTALEVRFQALMDILPQAVLVIDGRTGAVKEFNQKACDLFGYSRTELQLLQVEQLVPDNFKAVHVAYRMAFLSSVRKRQMGYHPPIFGIRGDGTTVQMSIALTATTADDDVMVVCSELSGKESDGQTHIEDFKAVPTLSDH